MKKFMKVCGICALILLGGGITLTVAGCSLVGAEKISRTVWDVTDGRFHVELDPGISTDFGVYVTEQEIMTAQEHATEQEHADELYLYHGSCQEATTVDQDDCAAISQVNPWAGIHYDEVELPDQNITKLDVSVGGCDINILSHSSDEFWLGAQNAGQLKVDVKDKTLHIDFDQYNSLWHDSQTGVIFLYVPQNFVFDSAEIEMGAGTMTLVQLYAQEVKIEVGAGQIYIGEMECPKVELEIGAGEIITERMAVGELEASVGLGNLVFNGSISDDSALECGMGSIALNLSNNEKDFSYKIDCSMGNIDLNGKNYSGLANAKEIKNEGGKRLKLECSMGSIDVRTGVDGLWFDGLWFGK